MRDTSSFTTTAAAAAATVGPTPGGIRAAASAANYSLYCNNLHAGALLQVCSHMSLKAELTQRVAVTASYCTSTAPAAGRGLLQCYVFLKRKCSS